MHSEICPVCQGEGKIRDKLSNEKNPCHGCNGRGWVEVQDNPNCYPILPQCPHVFSWPLEPYVSPLSWDQPNIWTGDYATAGDPSKVVYQAE